MNATTSVTRGRPRRANRVSRFCAPFALAVLPLFGCAPIGSSDTGVLGASAQELVSEPFEIDPPSEEWGALGNQYLAAGAGDASGWLVGWTSEALGSTPSDEKDAWIVRVHADGPAVGGGRPMAMLVRDGRIRRGVSLGKRLGEHDVPPPTDGHGHGQQGHPRRPATSRIHVRTTCTKHAV